MMDILVKKFEKYGYDVKLFENKEEAKECCKT